MSGSRLPVSSQSGIHDRLDEIVLGHLASEWQQPLRRHSIQSFDRIRGELECAGQLILDAGCGTGASTARLARRYPEALVIGVDKSRDRLSRPMELPDNARLVRAELSDFWRQLQSADTRLARHCLYYPNPWPKPAQLKRRWHAHPVFPCILALGGRLELRTNFEIYAIEFARALELAGVANVKVVSLTVDEPVSPFERKYAQSGHRLWKLTANL